jgi:hypothetical protein
VSADRADQATRDALKHLQHVEQQYETYVRLARVNELPTPEELELAVPYEAPTGDRPLGLVIDVDVPMGLQLTKQS